MIKENPIWECRSNKAMSSFLRPGRCIMRLSAKYLVSYGNSLLKRSTASFGSVFGGLFRYFPKNTR